MSLSSRRIDSARAAELYLSGMSGAQVAEVSGCSVGGIYSRLEADGVPMRNRGGTRRIPVDDEVLAQLSAEGLTGPEIAERTGMNVQTIYTRLHQQGRSRSSRGPKPEVAAAILQDRQVKAAAARTADDALRAACKAAGDAGLSGSAIARAVGVSDTTVGAWIAEYQRVVEAQEGGTERERSGEGMLGGSSLRRYNSENTGIPPT